MGDPTGAPRTVSPWCVAGRLGLPTQTSGPDAVFGFGAGGIPHSGLTLVEVDAGMVVKVGRQEVIDRAGSLWCDGDINVVQESHEVFVRC